MPSSKSSDDEQSSQPGQEFEPETLEDSTEEFLEEEVEAEGPEHRRVLVRREIRRRLDIYLRERLGKISRHQIQKLIDAGGVTINDKLAKGSTVVRKGDVVDVILPPPPVRYLKPEPIPIEVLYEDDAMIVLNKQAGLIVHPARSHLTGTLINALANHFAMRRGSTGSANQDGETVEGLSSVGAADCRPGIVHRLDKNTTGVMVVAKSDEAHWKLARQFEDRKLLKVYLAVVHGNLEDAGDAIDEPLGKHPTIREAYAVRRDSRGKQSVTLYRVREQYRGYSLVELELKSGRTHQIRVHMSYLGHPLAGDILYGGEPIGRRELEMPPIAAGARKFLTFARTREEWDKIDTQLAQRDDLIIAHPSLHAAMLQLKHPLTGEVKTFTAPLHEPMTTLVRELRSRPADLPVATQGCWIDLEKAVPA